MKHCPCQVDGCKPSGACAAGLHSSMLGLLSSSEGMDPEGMDPEGTMPREPKTRVLLLWALPLRRLLSCST